ncbi:MAG TPA: hypothetical protein VIH59_17665 [Candidatus Tectomicrobia bacterium]
MPTNLGDFLRIFCGRTLLGHPSTTHQWTLLARESGVGRQRLAEALQREGQDGTTRPRWGWTSLAGRSMVGPLPKAS